MGAGSGGGRDVEWRYISSSTTIVATMIAVSSELLS